MFSASRLRRISKRVPSLERIVADVCLHAMYCAVRVVAILSVSFLLMSTDLFSQTQEPDQTQNAAAAENAGVAVEVDGKPILTIYASVGGFTPQERVEAIQKRIVAVGKNRTIPVDAIHSEDHGSWTEILAGRGRILGITGADAMGAGRGRTELAAEYTEVIRQVVTQYRNEHTLSRLLWAGLYAVLATAVCVVLIVLLFWVRKKIRRRLDAPFAARDQLEPVQQSKVRLKHYFKQPLRVISRVTFWVLVLAVLQVYGTVVLRFFPATKYTSHQVTNWLFSELAGLGKSIIAYTPNLILLGFICLMTSCLIKVNEYFFAEVRDEKVKVRGFYPDWADPTAKLVRVLILVAAAIVAFPYLPGSQSPAFKGISVFLGVLLSLGSTSAVAHAVAGTILTYMRAFQSGDFVRIGDEVGVVIEKTLLVTRICTEKNEVITIPNGTILGGVVVNYSAEARRHGVIFHTVVTIGYSAAWRQVHELLLSAARATDGILHDPAPFVLQTALNDFYVSYELNAYTAKPREMQKIYSALHQNIQDKFNEAGVEINSPHYAALRDGNETTIPQKYVSNEYRHPVFEVRAVDPSANVVHGKYRSEKAEDNVGHLEPMQK